MRVIILAAGKGERLMPLTNNTPKSLLELANGRSVLESQLLSIHEAGIREVAIVTGYLTEQIEAKINKYSNEYGIKFQIIFNPFYDISNNLISLWHAKHYMEEDFIIINGDDIFKDSVIKGLINQEISQQLCMVIDRKNSYDQDDMKLIIEKDNILKIGKRRINWNDSRGGQWQEVGCEYNGKDDSTKEKYECVLFGNVSGTY
jgi:choline kinase